MQNEEENKGAFENKATARPYSCRRKQKKNNIAGGQFSVRVTYTKSIHLGKFIYNATSAKIQR